MKDAALFFNPTDENQLANTIKLVYEDATIRAKLINKGRVLIESIKIDNYFIEVNKIFDEFTLIRRCWNSENRYIHL